MSSTLHAPVNLSRGLIIRVPFVDWILDGNKQWELRGSATKVRGPIALIQAGSGTVVGACELIDVVGPLSARELRTNAKKLNMKPADVGEALYYGDRTFAWVLRGARRLKKPLPYAHPSGAVIWVNLDPKVIRAVERNQT